MIASTYYNDLPEIVSITPVGFTGDRLLRFSDGSEEVVRYQEYPKTAYKGKKPRPLATRSEQPAPVPWSYGPLNRAQRRALKFGKSDALTARRSSNRLVSGRAEFNSR